MTEFEVSLINIKTNGNIFKNSLILDYFVEKELCKNSKLMQYISQTMMGSVVFSAGCGDKSLMLIAGVHGDEIPPQLALVKLMSEIIEDKIGLNCRLYIVPFLIPNSTMNNSRFFNFRDMNRNANSEGITKDILDFAKLNNVISLCDCHSTDPNKKPGVKSVFCSTLPLIESSLIADFICNNTDSHKITGFMAGNVLDGAVEDESNLRGISSITCECVSSSGMISEGSVDEAYSQIISFLKYHKAI